MVNSRNRAYRGEDVELSIQYIGTDGLNANADSPPFFELADANGNMVVPSTTTGITNVGIGLYSYIYKIPTNATKGLWSDTWTAPIEGMTTTNTFSFIVMDPGSSLTGSIQLGDDVNFEFTDQEIYGINVLLKFLKARLRNDGKKPLRDQFGAIVYDAYGEMVMQDCDVFSDDILTCFLCQALSEFNMIPFFTGFTFADEVIYKLFSAAIVEGAYVFAISSQALLEKGRDFTISDGGISYQPPALGDFLQSHFGTWLSSYRERLKFIKNSIRPGPQTFGTYSNLSSGSPAFQRLKHLRSRRVV